jgi:hypothetical protein
MSAVDSYGLRAAGNFANRRLCDAQSEYAMPSRALGGGRTRGERNAARRRVFYERAMSIK